jgi:hypothetical protein
MEFSRGREKGAHCKQLSRAAPDVIQRMDDA